MSFAITNPYSFYTSDTIKAELRSFAFTVESAGNSTTQKIKDILTSPIGQGVIGFGLGLGCFLVYGPLTERVIKVLGFSITNLPDPFAGLGIVPKILLTPLVCVVGPIMEEQTFRGNLQEGLKDSLKSFYANAGASESVADLASRVTSVFFTAVIFGFVHFSNALIFWCNPILFLPQVVAATIMGIIFGLAKEFSGDLHLPIGMHIGNNTLAWAQCMLAS